MLGIYKVYEIEESQEKPKEKVYLKGTKIPYDENMVNKLKSDRLELIKLFQHCTEVLVSNDHASLRESLLGLRTKLTSHLLVENTRFYTYLRIYYENDPENLVLVNDFKQEMTQIGSTLISILEIHTKPDSKYPKEFKEQFEAIGKAFCHRIAIEEKDLYPLYAHPAGKV